MECYDVVIVGAGPGGLKCAETLGGSDKKVLVLEKNNEIGPKVCAGGLTEKDIRWLGVPDSLIEHSYSSMKVHVNGVKAHIPHHEIFVHTIDRKELGQWQLKKLEKFDNISVKTNSKVSSITKEYIVVNNEKIGYKNLVGADGSSSLVRRYVGLTKSENKGIGIQYIIETDKYKDFEIFLNSKLFKSWYAWIFPHTGYVSIGCGGDPKAISGNRLRENFDKWLKKNKIDVSESRYEGFPMECDYKGYKFDNAYLIGDAAGLVSELTGEGIYPAVVSGDEIAKQILDESHNPEIEIKKLLRFKGRHAKVLNLLNNNKSIRTLLFFLGQLMLKIPYYRKKIIHVLG